MMLLEKRVLGEEPLVVFLNIFPCSFNF
jgi:hypothetical protein